MEPSTKLTPTMTELPGNQLTKSEGLPPKVYAVSPRTRVSEVVELMRTRAVGDVVVAEDLKPVGILTDRDIVIRVTARGLNPTQVPVREVMSSPLITVTQDTEVSDGIVLMKQHGLRRLPIVDEQGRLCSILTLDDILLLQLDDQHGVGDIVRRQLRRTEEASNQQTKAAGRPRPDPWTAWRVRDLALAAVETELPAIHRLHRYRHLFRQIPWSFWFWIGVLLLSLMTAALLLWLVQAFKTGMIGL